MQQSDYILREIEKISVLLMGLIGKMIRKKEEGVVLNEDAYSEAVSELGEHAEFDIDMVLTTDQDAFEQLFRRNNGFDDHNTELIADLLTSMGEIAVPPAKKSFLEKAREVYLYLDKSRNTYSMERAAKLQQIEAMLKNDR